jgi:eukaryotic-like serine/threonine-protein kinase
MSQPSQIAQYQIAETLPATGKVRLYQAIDPRLQRKVVLKAIPKNPKDAQSAEVVVRFQKQAKASVELKHPGIVEVYEYGEDAGLAFVVSEFVEGCRLEPKLRVPIGDAGSLILQLLRALEYAHSRGVVHLNLAPTNLILSSKGELKVAEFGGSPGGETGSPYRSPEQIAASGIDNRSDVFSAGVLFYEWLTALSPFPGPAEQLDDQICHRQETPASRAKAGVPGRLDEVCARSLAKDPRSRYPTVLDFCQQIDAAYQEAFGKPPCELVSNETAVSAFLSSLRKESRKSRSSQQAPKPQPATPVISPPSLFPPDTLRAVERELFPFLGPVARVVVKEAASKASSLEALYDLAGESLALPEDRKRFLASCSRSEKATNLVPEQRVSGEAATATFSDFTLRDLRSEPLRSGPLNLQSKPPGSLRIAQPQGQRSSFPPSDKVNREGGARSSAGPPHQQEKIKPELTLVAKSDRSSTAESENEIVSRLEGLLGKQPESLGGYLDDAPTRLEQVIHAFVASADALVQLYGAKGKTGGLKPQDVVFDRLGRASIRAASKNSTPKTTVGGAVGSPRYAAPELLTESGSTAAPSPERADIYALGLIFYEILMGRKLFREVFPLNTDLEWLRWHADPSKVAPSLRSRLPDHSVGLSELLESMMEKNTAKRISDPAIVLQHLKGIAQQASRTVVMLQPGVSTVEVRNSPAPTRSKKKRANKKMTLIMITVAVIMLLSICWLLWILQKKPVSLGRPVSDSGSAMQVLHLEISSRPAHTVETSYSCCDPNGVCSRMTIRGCGEPRCFT